MRSIYENYKELEELWDCCLDEYEDKEGKIRIHDAQSQMETFEYFFGLRLVILLLRHSDNLSTLLQAKDLCDVEAQKVSKKTAETVKKMKCDEKFQLIWKDLQNKVANLHIDPPKLPWKRRAPPRIKECLGENAVPEFDEDNVPYYRKIYYEALDCITNTITDCFDQQDFKTSNWKIS